METEQILGIESMYWNNCLIRLALDCTLPMYNGMGLVLKEKSKFHELLRGFLSENLTKQSSYPWINDLAIQSFIKQVQKELNDTDYNNFIYFVTTVFDCPTADNWLAWKDWQTALLKVLFPEKHRTETFVMNRIDKTRQTLALLYKDRPFDKVANDALEGVYESLFLTNWDKQIFNTAEFDEKSDFNDPFLQIDMTIDMNRFQIFWEKNILVLPKEELTELYKLCNEVHLAEKVEGTGGVFVDEDGNVINRLLKDLLRELKKPQLMRRKIVE